MMSGLNAYDIADSEPNVHVLAPKVRLDYVAVLDEATWDDVDTLAGPARALVAASFGATRLIDNLLLPSAGARSVQNTGDAQGGS